MLKSVYCSHIIREQFDITSGCNGDDTIIVLKSGSFDLTVDGVKYTVNEGDAVFFKHHECFLRVAKTKMDLYYINITWEDIKQSPKKSCILNVDKRRVFENTIFFNNADYDAFKRSVEDLLYMHFALTETKTKTDDVIDEIKKYLTENIDKRLTLDRVAQKFNMSKSILISNFKLKTGITPIVFLNQTRIEQSKELLTCTDK